MIVDKRNLWLYCSIINVIAYIGFLPSILEKFYLCIEGCLAGLGNAIVSIFMVKKEPLYHFLESIHPPVADSSSYHLLSSYPFYEDERKVVFNNWLKKEMLNSKTQSMEL